MTASRFARENEIATIPTHRNWGCFRVNRTLSGRCSGGGAIRDALSSWYAGHQYQRLLSNWVLRGVPEPTRERRPGLALSHPCGIHRGLFHILDIRMGDMDGLHFWRVLDRCALYGGEPCGWARCRCTWLYHRAVSRIMQQCFIACGNRIQVDSIGTAHMP